MSEDKAFIYKDKYFKKFIDGDWVYVGIHSVSYKSDEIIGPNGKITNTDHFEPLDVWMNEYDSEGYINPPGSILHGDLDIENTYQIYLNSGFEEFIPEWEPKGLK